MKLPKTRRSILDKIRERKASEAGQDEKMPDDKGKYMGSCNRSSCLAPGAYWYNHSTRKYYCENCAHWLNTDDFNRRDALLLYGHDLCTEGEYRG